MSVVGERVGGGYPSTTDCLPHESASLVSSGHSKQETLTQCQPNGGPPFTTLGQHWPTSRMALARYMFTQ